MSLADVLDKFRVPSVPPLKTTEGTEKIELNQHGSPGSLGSPKKHRGVSENICCSACSHFTGKGKWCDDHKAAWNGRALQSPDELHPCRAFQKGNHTPATIPAATSEQTDIFRAMLNQIKTGRLTSPLWSKISRYLKKHLPSHMFAGLEELIRDQGTDSPPPHTKEWQSPFPCRCLDCTRQKGCKRTELVLWGLLCRHDCEEFKEVKHG